MHFTSAHLQEMGKQVCLALIINGDLQTTSPEDPQPDPECISVFQFNKKSILNELVSNKELLQDNNNDCTSGSDSDPSEDNLDPEEVISVYPLAITPKLKTAEKKKASTIIPKARAESNRTLSSQKERAKAINKCKLCGEPELTGHFCQKPKPKQPLKPIVKPQSSFNLVNQPYYNAAGKKVRDQATQTVQLSQTPLNKSIEEQKIVVENRTNSMSPSKKEHRGSYRANSSDEPAGLGKMWKQERAFPIFNRNSRQNSAWKQGDSIRK